MSIINQLFLQVVMVAAPAAIEEKIKENLPAKGQVQKKRRMQQDLWFFKSHTAEGATTSYWTYRDEEAARAGKLGYGVVWRAHGIPIVDAEGRELYAEAYNLRDTHSIFASGFLTFKDEIYTDSGWGRGAHEKLLFNHDGEETDSIRILNDTSDFIDVSRGGDYNQGLFLGGGNGGCPYHTVRPIGIMIINIISQAMDGKYKYEWSMDHFSGDDTGDYENDVLTIYNSPGDGGPKTDYEHEDISIKDYINGMYEKWSNDPDGKYTGLIIGDRDEDDLSQLKEKTMEGEAFFSIFEKPDPDHITGGYWGYRRDFVVLDANGYKQTINGPCSAGEADSCANPQVSQNEIDDAIQRMANMGGFHAASAASSWQ